MEGIGLCWRVSVCSQGTISISHDFTSDWRAEDMDCIMLLEIFVRSGSEGTTSSPLVSEHFQHLRVVTWSYLSSSRSSWIESLVILEGGSSPSAWIRSISYIFRKDDVFTILTRWTAGFAFRFTFNVKGCPDLRKWSREWCLSSPRQPPLKQVKQTSIPAGSSCNGVSPDRIHISLLILTWLSKHWVHSSLCTDWDSLGGWRVVISDRWEHAAIVRNRSWSKESRSLLGLGCFITDSHAQKGNSQAPRAVPKWKFYIQRGL